MGLQAVIGNNPICPPTIYELFSLLRFIYINIFTKMLKINVVLMIVSFEIKLFSLIRACITYLLQK